MEPMTLEDPIVLGTINYLKASAAEKDLYQSENATEALKDSFLFLAMKFSSRWQTKKVALALGTKFIMVLMMEGNTTWMTLMVRIAKLKVMVEVGKKF